MLGACQMLSILPGAANLPIFQKGPHVELSKGEGGALEAHES